MSRYSNRRQNHYDSPDSHYTSPYYQAGITPYQTDFIYRGDQVPKYNQRYHDDVSTSFENSQHRRPKNQKPKSQNSSNGDEDNTSMGLLRILSKFSDRTSLNGVPYIKSSKNRIVKTAWTLFLIIAIGALTFHLYLLFTSYYSYKSQSTVQLTFNTLPFPAVTICNVNTMRKSRLSEASEELQEFVDAVSPVTITSQIGEWEPIYETSPDTDIDQYDDHDHEDRRKRRKRQSSANDYDQVRSANFFDEFTVNVSYTINDYEPNDLEDSDYLDSWENEAEPSTFDDVQQNFRTLFNLESIKNQRNFGHQISDMILQCSFNGKRCLQKNFTHLFSSNYGNCYNLQYPKFISRKSGPTGGMTLILFLEPDEYLKGITIGKGARLVIHQQNTMPFPDDEGFHILAGTETSIGLKLLEVTRLEDPNYGGCTSQSSFLKKYGIKYTRTACQNICEENRIRSKCNCFNPFNLDMNRKIGNPDKLRACKSKTEVACMYGVQFRLDTLTSTCSCNEPCTESKYVKVLSHRQWPDTEYAHLFTEAICRDTQTLSSEACAAMRLKSDLDLRESFAKIDIFFEDLNYEQLEEEVSYELIQFVSDVGGTIGLWIGLSFMGIMEIINLIVDICIYFCCTKRKK